MDLGLLCNLNDIELNVFVGVGRGIAPFKDKDFASLKGLATRVDWELQHDLLRGG